MIRSECAVRVTFIRFAFVTVLMELLPVIARVHLRRCGRESFECLGSTNRFVYRTTGYFVKERILLFSNVHRMYMLRNVHIRCIRFREPTGGLEKLDSTGSDFIVVVGALVGKLSCAVR